tara:strand:+ start:2591 stop:4720 length:2130 start_codon:yes stop_codon:yes gene_type:complete
LEDIGFLKNMSRFFVQVRKRRLSIEFLLVFTILITSAIFSQSYGMGMSIPSILGPCVVGLLFSRFVSTTRWANIAGWFVEICAAFLFYIKISEGIRESMSVYDFLSELLPLFLILYTFKLVNARDIKFFTLIPFSVAVFVAGVSPSSLFSLNVIFLSVIIIGLITGCPMLAKVGEDKNIQKEWFSIFKRYISRLFFIVFGLVIISESIAPAKLPQNLGGNVQVGIENISPYRYTNFSSDIVPRSSYSGFSPYLSLKIKQAVHLSEDPAMEVTGPPTYWRGIVFDKYTGSSWEVSRTSTRSVHANPSINGFDIKPEEYRYFDFGREDKGWIKLNRSVTFFKSHGNFLFSPWVPNRLSFGPINNFGIAVAGSLYLNQSPSGAVLTPFETQEEFTYQVESVFLDGLKLQIDTKDISLDEGYGSNWNPNIIYPNANGLVAPYVDYYSLPEIPERVRNLVSSLSQEGSNEEKMQNFANFLSENMTYDLETEPLPQEEEATDWFVFESKTGWCEMFASALAVMGRVANIQTRVVGGYQGGEKVSGKSSYLIRDKDAHTWVEFWSDQNGWIAIDPTPESTLSTSENNQVQESVGAFGQVKKVVDSLVENLEFLTWSNKLQSFWLSIKNYLIGIFLLISSWMVFSFFKKKDLFSQKRKISRKIKKWIFLAKRDGVHKKECETLREFAFRWHSKTQKTTIIGELEAFETALYGKSSFF